MKINVPQYLLQLVSNLNMMYVSLKIIKARTALEKQSSDKTVPSLLTAQSLKLRTKTVAASATGSSHIQLSSNQKLRRFQSLKISPITTTTSNNAIPLWISV